MLVMTLMMFLMMFVINHKDNINTNHCQPKESLGYDGLLLSSVTPV